MTRLLCLLCSSRSNGEATMAMELMRRLTGRWELHAAVPTPSVPLARWAGATPHVYPQVSATLARERILQILAELRPDALLIADLALLHLSVEFGVGLTWLIPLLMRVPAVAALDLWDWDQSARLMDSLGEHVHRSFLPAPPTLGRLLPVPLNAPGPSRPRRARYAIMEDQGPLSTAERRAARERLGLGDRPVLLWTTSAWQHDVAAVSLQARRVGLHDAAQAGERCAEHFPPYALRLMAEVARRVPSLCLVHVGPRPFTLPDDVTELHYRHLPPLPPAEFRALLGSVDAVFSPNLPASSNVRALSLRVPVVVARQSLASTPDSTHPALHAYRRGLGRGFPWAVWPVGLHAPVEHLLADQPLRRALTVVDVMEPEALVQALTRVLTDDDERARLCSEHERYWAEVSTGVEAPDRALELALGLTR